MNSTEVYDSNDIMKHFDDLYSKFNFAKPTTDSNVTGNIFSILGSQNKYISGTYSAYLRRPELFGINGLNLLYALDVGQTFRVENLFAMFQSFLQKPPTTTEANIIFKWAEELMNNQTFIIYEPVFGKLNNCIRTWLDKKTFPFSGCKYSNFKDNPTEISIETFKPLMYNSVGINVINLIPYIAYIFTYHIYGYSFKFSDVYSQSSLKAYLVSLENWFASQYIELYREQDISILDNSDDVEIDDQTWKNFYKILLDSQKIIELRNLEINKTPDILNSMIETQQALNEKELLSKFEDVINRLVNICIDNSIFTNIYNKFPIFNPAFYDPNDLVELTSYFMIENNSIPFINSNFEYINCNSEISNYSNKLKYEKLKTGLNKLNYSFGIPFASGDLILEMFKGYLKNEFMIKKEDIIDEFPIYINQSNLDNQNLYNFLLPFFVHGVWRSEASSMKKIIDYLSKFEFFEDMFNLHNSMKIVYGNTIGSILVPIYFISLINEFAYEYCKSNQDFKLFNPFALIRKRVIDQSRINKLNKMIYSLIYIENKDYDKFVNNLNSEFYEIIKTNPFIIQPYIQCINNDVSIFSIGGCKTYDYLKYSNPFIRGYGFMSTVLGSNEELATIMKYLSLIKNETIYELIENNKSDETTIANTLITFNKTNPVQPKTLFAFEFNENMDYYLKNLNEFVNIKIDDKYILNQILKYSFKQTNASEVLDYEEIKVKTLKINTFGNLDPSTPSTENGYNYDGKFIEMKISPHGNMKNIPVYSITSKIETKPLITINPDGKRLIEITTPSENVFWIYTNLPKISKFTKQVELKSSGLAPNEGSFMLTDRIQAIPKI